jgi:hypothetical protein
LEIVPNDPNHSGGKEEDQEEKGNGLEPGDRRIAESHDSLRIGWQWSGHACHHRERKGKQEPSHYEINDHTHRITPDGRFFCVVMTSAKLHDFAESAG